MKLDCIKINNLRIFANHGVFDEEKKLGQIFVVNAELYANFKLVTETDELNLTVNYATVCQIIIRKMKENNYNLIEKCANEIAVCLLLEYSILNEVTISIKKEAAPIGYILDDVTVTISRSWQKAYIGIGSNMGNRRDNIAKSLELLDSNIIIIDKVSSIIETEPVGYIEQGKFLNCCIEVSTILDAEELLKFLLNIETQMGRIRTTHWGPRIIDMDILLFDNLIFYSDKLCIPHPYMAERLFVLNPLNEIAPNIIHPVYCKSIRKMNEDLLLTLNKTFKLRKRK